MSQRIKPYFPATLFGVVTILAVATAVAGLTGSVPSKLTRSLNGNGITGSITCEFHKDTPTAKRIATKWWVGTTKYDVKNPGDPLTGFPADTTVTVHFSTTTGNTKPPDTKVTIVADKTVALQVLYK